MLYLGQCDLPCVAGLKSNQYHFSTQRIISSFNIIFKLIHRQEVIFPKIKNVPYFWQLKPNSNKVLQTKQSPHIELSMGKNLHPINSAPVNSITEVTLIQVYLFIKDVKLICFLIFEKISKLRHAIILKHELARYQNLKKRTYILPTFALWPKLQNSVQKNSEYFFLLLRQCK